MASHLVIFSAFNWGDLRPTCGLAVTLGRKFPQLTISFIVDADFCSKAQAELVRQCISKAEEQTLLPRIRLLSLGRIMEGMTPEIMAAIAEMDPRDNHALPPHVAQRINSALPFVLADEEFVDDLGVKWNSMGTKPSVIISDFLMACVALPIKEASAIPIVLWLPWPASSFARNYAPSEFGGQVEGMVKECEDTWSDVKLRNGRSFTQIVQDVWAIPSQAPNVVKVKGLPPYYQWEGCPQETWWKPLMALYDAHYNAVKLARCADGVILATVPQLEPESLAGIREWFCGKDASRPVFCLGPQIPLSYHLDPPNAAGPTFGPKEVPYFPSGSEEESIDPSVVFLDKALRDHGKHSAMYISFGTMFFPLQNHVRILIETLLELEQPMHFVFSIAAKGSHNPDAEIPSDLVTKLDKSGRGMVVSWAPQQTILSHPAIGWIITHCGSNGTLESLSLGAPAIAWPFMGDQPVNALWMTEVLDAGFELLQVRTGPGGKHKAYRGGQDGTRIMGTDDSVRVEMLRILTMCQGERGAKKRANAQKARGIIQAARQEGGDVDAELRKFKEWLENCT